MSEPTVPFNDLGRGTASIRPELDEAIGRVVSSGWYVMGPEHSALEKELAAYLGITDAVLVANGTDALQLALVALGVTAGDRVLTAANAGGYTSTAARAIGAVPVYADVDPTTLLLTVESIEAAVGAGGPLPEVIVVTHLFGATADARGITEWAHARGVRVVEDCAQSLGAGIGGVKTGTWGDLATTSFYPTKNLGALGDAGAVFAGSDELATTLRRLRQYGWESKYRTTLVGGRNSRCDELQAAILRVKLPKLDQGNEARRAIHRRYEAALGTGARLVTRAGEGYVGHLAVLYVDDRDRAVATMTAHAVATDVHYPVPDHFQAIVAEEDRPSLPVTEAAARSILSVPLFPELTDAEVDRVCAALSEL